MRKHALNAVGKCCGDAGLVERSTECDAGRAGARKLGRIQRETFPENVPE